MKTNLVPQSVYLLQHIVVTVKLLLPIISPSTMRIMIPMVRYLDKAVILIAEPDLELDRIDLVAAITNHSTYLL